MKPDLSTMSDADLLKRIQETNTEITTFAAEKNKEKNRYVNEINERAHQKKVARAAVYLENASHILTLLKHVDNHCDDDGAQQSFMERGHPYCDRCFVLDAIRLNFWDPEIELEIVLRNPDWA